MAHITSIGAGMFSDLAITRAEFTSALPADAAAWQTLFATEVAASAAGPGFTRIKDVREFPSLGTPANIVNVPVYGSKTSQQVQGQADAPSMEITLNFIPADWVKAADSVGSQVGDGKQYAFRFALLNTEPALYTSAAAGLGTVANSQWYWIGKMEALLVNPQLTDANTATLTLSVQSEFFGAYTNASA
jgi:hypothetical protein